MRVPLPEAFLAAPIAHRAYHDKKKGRPENSRAAMKAAIAAGYPIEIDLQLSSDGVAMVFHDSKLLRLTGELGKVHRKTSKKLKSIKLKHSDDEGIPTLKQVLELVRGRVPLLIEIKDQSGMMGSTDGQLEQAAAAALIPYKGPVAVMSFNPHSVAQMRDLAPTVPRGLTTSAYDPEDWDKLDKATCDELRNIKWYDLAQCSFISHEAPDLARPRVAELKKQGATILCWTIKSAAAEAEARKVADNVTFEGYAA